MDTWRTHRKTQTKDQQEVTPTKAYTQTKKQLSTLQPDRPATLKHNWIAGRSWWMRWSDGTHSNNVSVWGGLVV